METAIRIVTTVFDKSIDSLRPRTRGPRGHAFVAIIRLLAYAILARYPTTRSVHGHLCVRPEIWSELGFANCPARSSIDRWKQQYHNAFAQCVALLGNQYCSLAQPDWTLLDSTPFPDETDTDGTWGKNSRGWFHGFKLHTGCDEHSVPLRAAFTRGNVHDSRPANKLLAPTPCVGGDSAYDSKRLKHKVRKQQSVPHFVENKRRKNTPTRPTHPVLKKVRSAVERCFSIIKQEVLQFAWVRVKGYAAKAAMAFASVLAVQALALWTLRTSGVASLRVSEVRR